MQTPAGWGTDSLSRFVENTLCNNLACYVNLKPIWQHLACIDEQMQVASENLHGLPDANAALVVAPLLLRSQASYRAGAQLASGGQLPEAYMVLRGCLENSLYAFHINSNPAAAEIWLRRDENTEAKKLVRKEFAISLLKSELEAKDPELGKIVRDRYESLITYGGHPNPYSILVQSTQEQDGSTLTTLTGDSIPMRVCLTTTALVGLCALHVFEHIFRHRFEILGISNKIRILRDRSKFDLYRQIPHTGPPDMAWPS